MSDQKIDVYTHPAGGWGALRSVAHQLKEQGIPAKGARTLLHANQPDGFDCPGCAWPDRNHGSSFEFCENGAKAVAADATARRCTPEVLAQYTVRELAAQSDYFLEGLGRLTHPMAYDPATDRYLPIEWDTAFDLIARHLKHLPDPNQAVFYTSGRTSNEAAFLYQWFVREYGTNNFPDCSNMCHEPSGVGLKGSIGVGKGTVTLDDFTLADTIFIFGQNPGTNHPRMLAELRAASKRGARIVSINPLRERGLERFANPQSAVEMSTGGATRISSHYFQPRIGGDLAVVKGLLKHLLAWDDEARAQGLPAVLDHAFIAQHTHGFDQLAADLRAERWDLIELESGLRVAQLREAAEVLRHAQHLIVCWGMGITQHPHAVGTVQMLSNLLLVGGHMGKPGAGACPVRGHSNVQGDRTMGIYEKPSAAFLDRLEQVLGFKPPREPGFDTVESIAAMADGRAKVFFGMGGNFAAATPDTPRTWAALRRCELTVQVSTKLNRSHVVHGRAALILPCLGRTETDAQATGPQSVTVEDSMSMVHLSRGTNAPASEHLLSEPAIVARLAHATLGPRQRWLWMVEDYDRIRERIEATLDEFSGFNQRVRTPGGFRLRNTASERVWATASGKAQFHVHPISQDTAVHRARLQSPMATVFTLATMRSHDQYNTTLYGLDDRYRGVWGQRRVVFIHTEDIKALGLEAGDWVDLHTLSDDGIDRSAPQFKLVAYDIPRGCLTAYYPETNPLVPLHSVAEGAGTPTSKYIPVRLTTSQAPLDQPANHCGLPESSAPASVQRPDGRLARRRLGHNARPLAARVRRRRAAQRARQIAGPPGAQRCAHERGLGADDQPRQPRTGAQVHPRRSALAGHGVRAHLAGHRRRPCGPVAPVGLVPRRALQRFCVTPTPSQTCDHWRMNAVTPTPLADLPAQLQAQGWALLSPADLLPSLQVSEATLEPLRSTWDDLPADPHLRDGGHYRFRRHSCYVLDNAQPQLTQAPHRAHWQPVTYNALHGGFERWFEPIDAEVSQHPAWRHLLTLLGQQFNTAKPAAQWFIEAHQFRVDTAGGIGRPTPEGAHRDGVDFVAVVMVGRHQVKGGETRVFEAEGPHGVRFTLNEPWSVLLLDDARVIHESTPIQPLGEHGWRDTLVLTYRSGGFQGPSTYT